MRRAALVPATVLLVVLLVVVGLAAAVGVALRAWLLAHLPLTGDEAVVGLMARQIDAGHLSTFYWGQHYGGVEPYVAAAVFAVLGPSPTALNLTSALLAAVAAVLGGALVRELTHRWVPAVAAGALIWVWPYAALWNSVHEFGFRQATLCCGLALLWCTARLRRGPRPWWLAAAFGLSFGLGWWASPEILYFAIPAGAVLAVDLVGALRRRAPGRPFPLTFGQGAAAIGGALVGAAPWLYTNVRTGFVSLSPASAGVGGGGGYMGRLGVFFDHTLPTQLGVQAVYDGAWVGGPVLGPILLAVLVAAVVVALAVAVRGARRTVEGGSLAMVALAVVLFPFLYAAVPGTAYWIDGRYGIYLGPLVAVLTLGAAGQVAGAASTAGRARHRASATSSSPRALTTAAVASAVAVVVGATVLTLAGAHESSGVPAASPSRFFTGWTDPDAAMRAAVAGLEAHGLGAAYGDYWTAYDLDLVAGDRIAVSPSVLDVDRRPQLAAAVAAAPRVGWLFFAPDQEAAASAVFSNPQPGPGAYDEGSFERLLQTRGVPYRVVHLGVLDAVVPARPFGSLPPTPSPGPAPG